MPTSSLAELARRQAQRSTGMSPMFDDSTLAANEAKRAARFTPKIEGAPTQDATPDEPSIDQIMANAQATLSRANRFSQDINSGADSGTGQDGADPAGGDPGPSVFDSATTRLGRLGKRLIAPIPGAAEKAAKVGSFLAPEVAIPSQILLGGISGKNLFDRGMEGVKEHPYLTGMDALGVAAGVHGLSKAIPAGLHGLQDAMHVPMPTGAQVLDEGPVGASRGYSWESPTPVRPQSHELPPYRSGTFNIENPHEGGFDKPAATPDAYDDYSRSFDAETEPATTRLSKLSAKTKKPKPRGK